MEDANMSLADTNDVLVSIIKNIPLGIIAIDLQGNITIANELAKINLSIPYSLKDITKKNIVECVDKIRILKDEIQVCLAKGRKSFRLDTIEYQNKFLSIIGIPIENGMIITITDITEKKESEKAMLRALIKGQEEERKRIAKEIHDGLGPMLSAVKMHVQAVQSDLDSIEKNTLNKLETTYDLIDNVASDMRSLSHDLMPRIVEDFGLTEALISLTKTHQTENAQILFTHNLDNNRFSKIIELNLFRIAQELLHNSLKHSEAKKITLQLIKHTDTLILMLEDNGKGFNKKDKKNYGIGLKNIETRVIAMGGVFTIDSMPDSGVTATVEIPLPTQIN